MNQQIWQQTLRQIVENYHAQVKIIEHTDLTLSNYLNGIKFLTKDDIIYALEYSQKRNKIWEQI